MAPAIKLFWWRRNPPHSLNFGDEFTAPLIERLTGRRVRWASPADCDLVGAGSVVQMILRKQGGNRPTFWGSGIIRPLAAGTPRPTIDARAVRGLRTLGVVDSSAPGAPGSGIPADGRPALGDPGILASRLLDGPVRKRYALGIVPHYQDVGSPVMERFRGLGSAVRVIDVGWTPEEVAAEISACETVLSSSLHGLIFSDGLGVPSMHVRMGDKLVGGSFKFEDYYSAFEGEDRYRVYEPPTDRTHSLHELVDIVQSTHVPPQGLARLQQGLIEALPVDAVGTVAPIVPVE
ncbi:polysaccharide pyruvyl transferase family protein [Brachybacterium sp. DNPG3]